MSASNELTEVISDLDEAVTDFKKKHSAELAHLRDQHGSEIAELRAQVRDLETTAARPYGSGARSGEVRPEARAAWRTFLRGGNPEAMMPFANPQAAATTQVGPNTGWLVPQEIDGTIEKLQRNFSPLRQVARVYLAVSDTPEFLVNTRGATANWVGEASTRPDTENDQLAKVTVPLGELQAMPSVSQRMIDDAGFPIDEFITTAVAEQFAQTEGAAFSGGDGVNKPRGFLTYPTSANPDTTRPFGTIQYRKTGANGGFIAAPNGGDCLISLVHDLRPAYRQGDNVAWWMNSTTLAAVRLLKDSQGRFLWAPGVEAGQPDLLLGYPVLADENAPDMAAGSFSIAFANWSRALLICDHAVGTRVLRDPFTNKPYVRFYATKRVGSALYNSEAIKLLQFSA